MGSLVNSLLCTPMIQRGRLVMPLVIAQYKFVICEPDSQHTGCLVAADIGAAVTDITCEPQTV